MAATVMPIVGMDQGHERTGIDQHHLRLFLPRGEKSTESPTGLRRQVFGPSRDAADQICNQLVRTCGLTFELLSRSQRLDGLSDDLGLGL
jgi:hypothetical protein